MWFIIKYKINLMAVFGLVNTKRRDWIRSSVQPPELVAMHHLTVLLHIDVKNVDPTNKKNVKKRFYEKEKKIHKYVFNILYFFIVVVALLEFDHGHSHPAVTHTHTHTTLVRVRPYEHCLMTTQYIQPALSVSLSFSLSLLFSSIDEIQFAAQTVVRPSR